MRIIVRTTPSAVWARYLMAERFGRHWYEVADAAFSRRPIEVLADFSKAKALDGERVLSQVASGNYCLVVSFDRKRSLALIEFVGWHADYDAVDALTVRLF